MNVIPTGEIASAMMSSLTGVVERQASGADSFGKIVSKFIDETNNQQVAADQSIEKLATGQSDSVHETMLALTKADLSLRVFMEVRNKVIEAYQDVMRMQV